MMPTMIALFGVALAAIAYLTFKYIALARSRRDLERQHTRLQNEEAALRQSLDELQRTNSRLQKYEGISDAESAAAALIADAEQNARAAAVTAQQQAESVRAAANNQAAAIVAAAHLNAQGVNDHARAGEEAARAAERDTQRRVGVLLSTAEADADRIRAAAIEEARKIAGDAYAAKEKADELQRTAKALKNVIEGYGDRYLVPTFGLLDDLAEEFGFADAGQRLKAARAHVRTMVKQETAATCDYVEENRRETAIAFVLDAFNGKVDSVLADVRSDNHGTLSQKIRDAFELVNHHGQAFRNARILPAYLDARLDELKWAVVAQELKAKEREEQRVLKERLREEERAQREYEKAQRDAAKEEDLLRKAMEKARREVDRATDEEKAKYEALLAELQAKLVAAEDKNKRALSMAQQTKAGHVYVISNVGSFGEDVFKIGLTRRLEPLDRVRELGDASVPFEFDVHALIRADDAPALEHRLHKHFVTKQVNKVNARKEFFRVPLHEIREEIEKIGFHTSWTIAALCREWKETQAIERAMKSGTFEKSGWVRQQMEEIDQDRSDPDADESVDAPVSKPTRVSGASSPVPIALP